MSENIRQNAYNSSSLACLFGGVAVAMASASATPFLPGLDSASTFVMAGIGGSIGSGVAILLSNAFSTAAETSEPSLTPSDALRKTINAKPILSGCILLGGFLAPATMAATIKILNTKNAGIERASGISDLSNMDHFGSNPIQAIPVVIHYGHGNKLDFA